MTHADHKHADQKNEANLKGKIIAFNVSPKGNYEGLLLNADGKNLQVNFSPEESARINETLKEGDTVELTAKLEEGKKLSDHPVYKLLSFNESRKKHKDSPHRIKVKGKIIRLNYTKHGEINGAILEDGCFVHLKPEGVKAYPLKVGETLEVEGEEKPGTTHRVIDVYEIGGKEVPARHHKV